MTQPDPTTTSLDMPAWLLSPEHAARMGGSLWVYLWLWREARACDDPRYREVRGGGTWRTTEIGEALGLQERTVRRHLATLCQAGYLVTNRAGQGLTAHLVMPDSGGPTQQNADNIDRSAEPERPNLSGHGRRPDNPDRSGDESGQICPVEHPPAPPLRVLKESFLDSVSSGSLFSVPTTAKRAQLVPLRGRREASPPKPPAVAAAAKSPARLRQEQTITHLLSRVEAWERPSLTRTLLESLCAVPLEHLPAVFEQAWRFHRTRYKALDNPAGWWAETLRRCAEACQAAVKGLHDYG